MEAEDHLPPVVMDTEDHPPPAQTVPSLRRFSIPKQAKSKDLLTQVSFVSRDGREIIRNIQNSMWDASLVNIKYEKIDVVTNEKLELEYVNKRKEMKKQQYTSSETADIFAYLFATTMNECIHICKNGLRVGERNHLPSAVSLNIGHKLYGVYVFRCADAVTRRKLYDLKSDCFLIVFKIIKGRLKQVSCNPDLEPTPEFDGHVSKDFQLGKKISQDNICNASLLYLYEVNFDNFDPNDDSAVYSKRPRQCIPYAIVKFQASQKLVIAPSISISNRPTVVHGGKDTHPTSSVQQRTAEIVEEFVYERYFIKSVECWSGYLYKNELVYSEISLRVFSAPLNLPVVGSYLCISQKISLEKLQKVFPAKIFRRLPCESFIAQVHIDGFLFTHAEIHPSKTLPNSVRTLTKLNEHLRKSNIAGFCNLACGIKLYVIPTCDVTDKLGITNQEYPSILHCIFMQRNADSHKSYAYSLNEYESFINRQKEAFKIRFLNQEALKVRPVEKSSKFSSGTAERKHILECFQAIKISLDKRRNSTKLSQNPILTQHEQENTQVVESSSCLIPNTDTLAMVDDISNHDISNQDVRTQLASGQKLMQSSSDVKPIKKQFDATVIQGDSNSDSLVIDTAQSQDDNLYSDVSDMADVMSRGPTINFSTNSNETVKNVLTSANPSSGTPTLNNVAVASSTENTTLHDLKEEMRKELLRHVRVTDGNDKTENLFQDISSSSDMDDMQRKLQENRKSKKKSGLAKPSNHVPGREHESNERRSYGHYGKSRPCRRRSRSRSISPRRRHGNSPDREKSQSPPLFQPANAFPHLKETKTRRKEGSYPGKKGSFPVRAKNSSHHRLKKERPTSPASQGSGWTNTGCNPASANDTTDNDEVDNANKMVDSICASPSHSEDELSKRVKDEKEKNDGNSNKMSKEVTQSVTKEHITTDDVNTAPQQQATNTFNSLLPLFPRPPIVAVCAENILPHQYPLLSFPTIPPHHMSGSVFPYAPTFLHSTSSNLQNCFNHPNPVVQVPTRPTNIVSVASSFPSVVFHTGSSANEQPRIIFSTVNDKQSLHSSTSAPTCPLQSVATTSITSPDDGKSFPTVQVLVSSTGITPVSMDTAVTSLTMTINKTSPSTFVVKSDITKPDQCLSEQVIDVTPETNKLGSIPVTCSAAGIDGIPTCSRSLQNKPTSTDVVFRLEVKGHACFASLDEWSRHLSHSQLDAFCEDLIKQVSLDLK